MYIIEPDSTSQSILVKLVNSSTGLGLTGLTFETASLTCYYKRGATGASTAISLVTQTATGAYSSGGFVAIDGTYQPGVYRLDLPNAVVATGVPFASISFQGAANLKDETVLIQLLAVFDTSSDTVTLKSGTHTGAVIPTVTATGSVSGNVDGNVTGTVGELADQAKADVNAQMLDVLNTDTIAAVTTDPGTTPTALKILRLIYQALRNKITATDSELALYNDAGNAEAFTKALSDDDTTFTSGTLTDA